MSSLRTTDATGFLRQQAPTILRRWEARVRGKSNAAREQSRRAVLDNLSELLEKLAAKKPPSDSVSLRHATERLEQGYGLAEVVMEYVELRSCIFERLEELGLTIPVGQSRRLNLAIDHALRETARRYATTHEKMLQAVDRLVGKRAAPRTLDETLKDILQALRGAAGADVDSVAIFLVGEDGRIHLRAAIGFEAEIESGLSLAIGEGFAGSVAEKRTPLLVRDAARDPTFVSASVRRRGTRALYGVPLADADRLIGVAHVGSRTAYEFSDEDLMLFRALCERATMTLVRAQFVETLERTSRFREQFIGILGHDLRNPLGAILGSAALLVQQEDALPDRLRAAPKRILRSGERMERLITHVLDFTRARLGGGFALRRSRFSMLAVARDVADEIAPSLSKRRIQVRGVDVRGEWDRERLAQVLSNLVGNAVQHSPDGSRIRIDVARSKSGGAVVDVWNEGPPIPKGTKLFEPFERATDKKGGLGLGLYIAHEIVRAHDGTLTVRSDQRGTTFTVTVPTPRKKPRAKRRKRTAAR